jgi:hypothetical protein
MYVRIPLYSCANITDLSDNYSSLYKKMHNKRERYNLPWHSFIIKDDIEYIVLYSTYMALHVVCMGNLVNGNIIVMGRGERFLERPYQ